MTNEQAYYVQIILDILNPKLPSFRLEVLAAVREILNDEWSDEV